MPNLATWLAARSLNMPEPVVHERAFTLNRATGALRIVDAFEGQGRHHFRWHFRFAPGVDVMPSGEHDVFSIVRLHPYECDNLRIVAEIAIAVNARP